MSATDEALHCGGARPKTNVGSGKKERKTDHDQRKDIKSKKIHVCDESFIENMNHGRVNGSRQLQSADIDVSSSRGDVNVVKPRWNKSYHDAVPPSSSIFNYNCEVDPDLSINSINLFRTKQPSLKPIPVGNRVSEDNLMAGSLHNLSLDTDGDASETLPKFCSNGASDILCDELNCSRTRDILSPQSSTKASSCGSCKLDDPEALAKWRTAGLALRHLLSKKSCQENIRPSQSSPSHKLHHKAGRTSCWLERLKDFDEFEEEYFSCCTCDDTEDVTLTKTGSSSSLGSLDSEQLLKLPSEIREETCDSCSVHFKVTDSKDKEIKNCAIDTIEAQENRDIPNISISSSCDPLLAVPGDEIESKMGKYDVSDFDKNQSSSCAHSTPLTNSVCNSIVWEMLQKPYSLALSDGPGDNSFSLISENTTQSPKNCDIFQCNNSYSQKMLDISYTAPLSRLLPEISTSNSTSRICGGHMSSVSLLNNDESAQITDGNIKSSLLENFETNKIHDASVDNNELSESIMSKRPTDIAIAKNNLGNFHTSYSKDGLNTCKQSSPEHKPLKSTPRSLLTKSSLTIAQPTTASYNYNSCWYGENFTPSCNNEFKSNDSKYESFGGSQNQICTLGTVISVQETFPQSKTDPASGLSTSFSTNNPCSSKPIETESEVTDCSSVYADTSGEIFFSEGTDSSDLPSKFLRLNPTKNSTEYYARHTGKEKKKKVLHARKTLRRSGSTSSDVEDGDKVNEKKGSGCLENHDDLCGGGIYTSRNSSMLSDLLHPSTPLARFLKSHTSNPHDNQSASMPWENIEDGLSVESCADGDSVAGFSDGSTLQRKNSWTHNTNSASDKDTSSHYLNTEGIAEKGSSQDRPSTALRKLLNMEMNTELKGDNSQYSPETWVRLVDQISLPFECAEEDGNEMVNDTALVDSTEKSNEFTDLCLPNYESSTSCDADDEFECDCEHCQLLKNMGNTDELPVSGDSSISAVSGQNPTTYSWPDFLEDDTSLDLDLSELRPLEPLLMNLQDIPQDLIDIMFQTVIMQMLTVHPELMGDEASPPVPQDVIESLPIIITTQIHIDQEVSCPICLCPCQLNESLTRLCCQHLYHPLCIQAWLAKSGTCPVCRSAVNGSSNDDVT